MITYIVFHQYQVSKQLLGINHTQEGVSASNYNYCQHQGYNRLSIQCNKYLFIQKEYHDLSVLYKGSLSQVLKECPKRLDVQHDGRPKV